MLRCQKLTIMATSGVLGALVPAATQRARYGQLVIGAPGAGKTTYCEGLCQLLPQLGRIPVLLNLDPANDPATTHTSDTGELRRRVADVDVRDLIRAEDAAAAHALGPNGALSYCMAYLVANLDWLLERVDAALVRADAKAHEMRDASQNTGTSSIGRGQAGQTQPVPYLVVDIPGQVELITHSADLQSVLDALCYKDRIRLVALQLVDVQCCTDAGRFMAASIVALQAMIRLELPHINVLSKGDLVKTFDDNVKDNIDRFMHGMDEEDLSMDLDQETSSRYRELNHAMAEVMTMYHAVSFTLLSVEDKESMLKLLRQADTANGYALAEYATSPEGMMYGSLLQQGWV